MRYFLRLICTRFWLCVLSEKPADYDSYCLREEAIIISFIQHTNRQAQVKQAKKPAKEIMRTN